MLQSLILRANCTQLAALWMWLPANSGVLFGGGPGGAGVKTHGSDVVKVASATSLLSLFSVSSSPRKYGVIRIPFMSSIGSVSVWVMANHTSLHILTARVPSSSQFLHDGNAGQLDVFLAHFHRRKLFNFISLSYGHTVLNARPTTLLNAWDIFTQLHVFTFLFFSCFLCFAIPALFRGRAFLRSCALRLMAKKCYSGDVWANPKSFSLWLNHYKCDSRQKWQKEKVEITTIIRSLCTSASLRVRESVVAFLLISWILQLSLVQKTLSFCVGQTDSKYPLHSGWGPWPPQKRCIWHFGCDGGLQSGSSPLSQSALVSGSAPPCSLFVHSFATSLLQFIHGKSTPTFLVLCCSWPSSP